MKKLIVSLTLLAASCMGAFAQQEIFDNPDNSPYFGVRASLDITSPSDAKLSNSGITSNLMDNGVGFSVGAIYNVPVYKNLYFEPGVTVYRHNAKERVYENEAVNYKISVGEWGFAIPLMFGYHFDFDPVSVAPFTGPEFSIGVKGERKYTNNQEWNLSKSMYSDDESSQYNRANAAWRFGVGLNYEQYFLSVSGAVGIGNWRNSSNVTIHRNTVSITLGYNF